jgi:uncharacterized protein YciI
VYDPNRKQQLFVAVYRLAPNPPKLKVTADELQAEHRSWLKDLSDRKILVGSGPSRDEKDQNHGYGAVMIFRVGTKVEAEKLAREEPICREGQRVAEVVPWHRVWFED